jgi:hypothetical protein
MKLPDEVLDAAVAAYQAHEDHITGRTYSCACGEQFLAADVSHQRAQRLHLRHQMQAIADALAPYLRDGITREEWRVSGDPGPRFGLYNFVWPRPGQIEDGEEQARAFIAEVTEPGRLPWDDGPYLHHRTIYTEEGSWLPAEDPESTEDLESRSTDAN